jgi:ornithine cyclodeaminase
MLLLSESDVVRCLTMPLALQASAHAFYSITHKTSETPTRLIVAVPDQSSSQSNNESNKPINDQFTLFKPCITSSALGLKVVSVRPNNAAINKPTVPATIQLIDRNTGLIDCLMGGTNLTAIRTAAGSALATQLFSEETSKNLVIFGAGAQSYCHFVGHMIVRTFTHCTIVNRSLARANELVDRLRITFPNVHFSVVLSEGELSAGSPLSDMLHHVLAEADVICLCTGSKKPVILSSMVKAGCHINAVGSYTKDAAEMDGQLVLRCKVVVDALDTAWSSGDLQQPLDAGLIDRKHVRGEMGEYLPHRYAHWPVDLPVAESVLSAALHHSQQPSLPEPKVLRTNPSDITLFKSVGTAAQDIVSAHAVYEAAIKAGIGYPFDIDS